MYAELDEQLQSDFSSYLAERGINEDLGAYLLQLMHDKEQRWAGGGMVSLEFSASLGGQVRGSVGCMS